MAEQYIYSRSERGFTNARNQAVALGFGFVASSPGLSQALRQDAAVHCEDCPRPVPAGREEPIPLLRKARLPRGQVLLQKSGWVRGVSREFHVAHGYVLAPEEVKSAGPAGWLNAGSRLEDPNGTPGGVLLDHLDGLPVQAGGGCFGTLEDAAGALGLGKESFCQLLLACFDALASRRLVLLAHDFRQGEEERRRASVLYWIYNCLPYDLWLDLGFDSVYTEKTTPKLVQLAFVDREALDLTPPWPKVRLAGQEIPLGGGFLAAEGRIIHNNGQYKTDWYGQEGAFGRWLARNVDALWTCPGAPELPALEQVREELQSRLAHTPEADRLTPHAYGAACAGCRVYSAGADAAPQGQKDAAPQGQKDAAPQGQKDAAPQGQDLRPAGQDGSREAEPAALSQTEKWVWEISFMVCRERRPATDVEICLLSALEGAGRQTMALGVLGAWAAMEMELAGPSPAAVLERYRALLPQRLYALVLERIFWAELAPLEQTIWITCGVKWDTDAAKGRRLRWYVSCAQACPDRLPDTLSGIKDGYRQSMEEELRAVMLSRKK